MTADLVTRDRAAEGGAAFPSPSTNIAPSAFGGDFRRLRNLTLTLAVTEFRLRYLGSVLGYVWSLLRPLLFFGVIYVVFTQIFHVGGTPHYGVYMLANIILWSFFLEATGASIQCLVAREGLLRKMRFPRLAIPLSVCLTSFFTLVVNLVVVVVFALANGVNPRWTWLELPVIVAVWGVLALGVGMILSVLYVRMHDVQPIWDVISQVLFYGSPLIYALSKYPKGIRSALLINPISALATQMGHALIGSGYPSLGTAMGGTIRILAPVAVIVAIAAGGLWLFVSRAPQIAENL